MEVAKHVQVGMIELHALKLLGILACWPACHRHTDCFLQYCCMFWLTLAAIVAVIACSECAWARMMRLAEGQQQLLIVDTLSACLLAVS